MPLKSYMRRVMLAVLRMLSKQYLVDYIEVMVEHILHMTR